MADTPQPLGYATPEVNRRPRSHVDGVPLVMGALQVVAAILLILSIAPHPTASAVGPWFVRLARGWLDAPRTGAVAYAMGGVLVVAGAVARPGRGRGRWYGAYAAGWAAAVVGTVACLLVVGPWPGERRWRTSIVHNLSAETVTAADLRQVPMTAFAGCPALPVIAFAAAVRRGRRAWAAAVARAAAVPAPEPANRIGP